MTYLPDNQGREKRGGSHARKILIFDSENRFSGQKKDRVKCLFCRSGGSRLVSCPRCECTALTLASTMENMITKFYHELSALVHFSFFLWWVENGAVEHGLGPEGPGAPSLE